MGLETGTYISNLVSSNPTGTDFESQGDDHLRLIKSVLQSTFPGANRPNRFMAAKTTQTTSFTLNATTDQNCVVGVDATAGSVTISFPVPTNATMYLIQKIDNSANTVVLDPTPQGINGVSTLTLTSYGQSALVYYSTILGAWVGIIGFPYTPYYSGGQDIPFSDLATIANQRLLGSFGSDLEAVTIISALGWLIGTRGDIITVDSGGTAVAKALGASGTFLKSDGSDLVYGLPLVPAFSSTTYATNTTITGTIPYDDSIPQVGEGTEILSTSITAIKSSSKIKITFQGFGGVASSGPATAALFIDGAASAVQATIMQTAVVNTAYPIAFEYVYTPGDTSAHTISVRFGANTGNSFLNGAGIATRRYGGAAISTLVCQEIFTA